MDRKHIKERSKQPSADPDNTQPETREGTESIEETKTWKNTLAKEWVWFAFTLLGSVILSSILEYYVPAGVEKLTIILFVLVYLTRLTVWAIMQMGKG